MLQRTGGQGGRYEAVGARHVSSPKRRKAWRGMCYEYFTDKTTSPYLVLCIFSIERKMEVQRMFVSRSRVPQTMGKMVYFFFILVRPKDK